MAGAPLALRAIVVVAACSLPAAAGAGLAETLSARVVNVLMGPGSPLRGPVTAQAKKTMKATARSVGIDWDGARDEMRARMECSDAELERVGGPQWRDAIPEYYRRAFHAYDDGNLGWDAAVEQEIASKAVGARNYPSGGENGDNAEQCCSIRQAATGS